MTWTVRRMTCVFTFGFGFCIKAACVWVAVPVLELSAYPPSPPSPATLASAAIFILRLLTWRSSFAVAESRIRSLRRARQEAVKRPVKGGENLDLEDWARPEAPVQ